LVEIVLMEVTSAGGVELNAEGAEVELVASELKAPEEAEGDEPKTEVWG
jgi:hypothetical protein